MDLLADTTFLIDLWREQRKAGPATTFAGERADLTLGLPWIVAGEFLGGGVIAGHDRGVRYEEYFTTRSPCAYAVARAQTTEGYA